MKILMKKLIAVICILAFIPINIPCMAEEMESETVAWVDFSKNKEMWKFSAVSFAEDTSGISTVNTVTVNGNQCWEMKADSAQYIRFNLNDSTANKVTDGTEYAVEVEYYDGDTTNEKQGFFSLEYDAVSKNKKSAGIILLTNSGTWKTARFVLDDAYFGNRIMNGWADFRLTVVPQKSVVYSVSPNPVAIRRVRVVKTGVKRTVRAVSSTNQVGNAFGWDSDQKQITNTLTNTGSTPMTADVTFIAMLDGDKTMFETTKTITIPADTSVNEAITLPLTRCGVYDWVVRVSEKGGSTYDRNCMKFAVIKTDKNGIKNEAAYVAQHLDRYFVANGENREIHEGIELISKSNAAGIRAEGKWNEMLPEATSTLSFDGSSMELFDSLAKQYGLGIRWLLPGGTYAVTGAWNSYPDTTDEWNAYQAFVTDFAGNVKDSAVSFEVAHEIDQNFFNPVINSTTGERDATPEEYVNLIKTTREGMNAAGVSLPLLGYGLVDFNQEETWIDKGLELGVLDYLDAVSYHPYTHSYSPEAAWGLWYFPVRLKEKLQNVNPNTTLAVTELGYTLADNHSFIDGKRSRGANIVRGGIAYTVRDLADFVTHYVFEDKGQLGEIEQEDGYGMVDYCDESLRDESDAIFVPNDSFLSFTAMNYLLAQSEPWQVFELGDNISASGFTSRKFNNKIVVLNTMSLVNGDYTKSYDITKEVTVKLGTNQITCYDDFGNATTLTSGNGIYTFMLNERPFYIAGAITEVTKQSSSTSGIREGSLTLDGTSSLNLYTNGESTYTAELLLPDCVQIEKNVSLSGETTKVELPINEALQEKSVAEAVIRDAQGNQVFFGQVTLKPEEKEAVTVQAVTTNLDYSTDASATGIKEIRIEFTQSVPTALLDGIVLQDTELGTPVFTKSTDLNVCILTLSEAVDGVLLQIEGYNANGVQFSEYQKSWGTYQIQDPDAYLIWDAKESETAVLTEGASSWDHDESHSSWYEGRVGVLRDENVWSQHTVIGDTLPEVVSGKTVKLSFDYAPKGAYYGAPDFHVSVFNQNVSFATNATGQFKGFREFDRPGVGAETDDYTDARITYHGNMENANANPYADEWAEDGVVFNNPTMPVTRMKWYHVESVYDLKNETVTHYVDGQLLGVAKGPDKIGAIGIYRDVTNKRGWGELNLYNLRIVDVTPFAWDATTSETAMLGAVTNGTSPNWDTTNADWYGGRLPVLRDDAAWGDHLVIGDKFDQVIAGRKVKVSFEFAPKATYLGGPDFYVSVFNQNTSYVDGAEGQFKGFAEFDPNGTDSKGENGYDAVKMSYYGTETTANTSPCENEWTNPIVFTNPTLPVTQGQWYQVESVYDLEKETVTHYVNGQLLGVAKGPDRIGGISIYRRQNNKLGYGELDIYNLRLCETIDNGEILFCDKNNQVLSREDLRNETLVQAKMFTVTANGGQGTGYYICAKYRKTDDVFQNAVFQELPYSSGGAGEISRTISLENGEYAKVFLWDTQSKPLCREYTIGK